MWIFAFLYLLGINICQAAYRDNSTQMYYAKMTIDNTVLEIVRGNLRSFTNNKLTIDDIRITTDCNITTTDMICKCSPGHIWSDEVCQPKSCCGKNICTFEDKQSQRCILNTTVNIFGSVTLEGREYEKCLKEEESVDYKKCHDNLLKEMKRIFNTFRGFDSVTIKSFGVGSVIADFLVTIVSGIKSQDLMNKSQELVEVLKGKLNLETKGVVSITMPEQPVHYNSSVQIQCTSEEDLGQDQQWHLETPAKTHEIVEGTISKLKSEQKKATVTLTNINERWEGKYICNYKQKSDLIHLNHKASATMDICHMPMIEAFTEPAFPLCAEESSVFMKTKCRIRKSSENYKVTWKGATIEPTDEDQHTKTYTARIFVGCEESPDAPEISCTFKNRCNQIKTELIPINIIKGDKYCKAEGDWAITKRGFSAHLKCHIGVGLRSRKCNSNAEWEAERSDCVTEDLNVVRETAQIIDQGLGHLEKNAAEVFSKFENFTKTSTINSYVNMEVSVSVLSILDSKLSTIEEENMVDDLLDSSSHLLNRSLARTWKENRKENSSLAENYLTSVEQLIVKANITNKTSKPNLEVDTCTGETCNRSVFDVNISLTSSGSGKVKLAGFQQLDGYLPTKTEDDKSTNSIVVVVTKENALEIQSITIDFMLTNSRLRNVELTCVFWDNSSHSWSPNGCEWGGPLDERRCICTHLSAFSILMSKKPLKVPALSQITLVGLSISVASLVISLLIELIVWSKVVKTNTLYLRHAAHVNISVCLLIADCCFLATFEPEHVSERLCVIFAALKHFCYLSMFFWMLCLSSTLLHQAVFLFHKVSKKYYLRFSLVVGYVCPFLIVFVTFLVNEVGAEGSYYSKDTCWLVFKGSMEDSIFTFVIPVGTIVFFNMFSMMVVIIKLLDHHKITQSFDEKEKCAAKTVIRSVILLTPVFGLTWFFGFFVLMFDLTKGLEAFAVNYIFTLLNSFQGLFILLTTCLGDKMTRDALLSYFNKKAPGSISESTTNLNSTCKK